MLQEVDILTLSSLNFQEPRYVSQLKFVLGGDSGPTRQIQEEAVKLHPGRARLKLRELPTKA